MKLVSEYLLYNIQELCENYGEKKRGFALHNIFLKEQNKNFQNNFLGHEEKKLKLY